MGDGKRQSALCDLQTLAWSGINSELAHTVGEIYMDTNQDIVQGKWQKLKGQVKQQWSKLTDDDIRRISSNTNEFTCVLQQRYGYGKVQAEMEINHWVSDHDKTHTKI
jgi:uncharacterized protein YjbJ (UPF0337 family)